MTDNSFQQKHTGPHAGVCTCPACAPDLWAAGIKGVGRTSDSTQQFAASNKQLRVVKPLRMHGYTLAEVFVSKIGVPPSLVLTFDTDDGSEASVHLTAVEATDLMLWLQRALNASETHGWRPIKTAPKDGRRVLLANASRDDGVHVGYWDAYYAPDGSGYDGGDGWVIDASGDEYRLACDVPTHWMPLPKLPAEEMSGEQV